MDETPSAIVRKMLAVEVNVEPSLLTDDFRWLEAVGDGEDVEFFLSELNHRFTYIPRGLTLGSGDEPFQSHLSEEFLEQIATVGGLIEHIERHNCKASTPRCVTRYLPITAACYQQLGRIAIRR